MKRPPKILNCIVDKVLAYKPKKEKKDAKNRETPPLCKQDKG
jgi:hypothetical protein